MSRKSGNSSGSDYEEGSLALWGAVSMGTGVMIGAGIFALTGQIADLAGAWFPLAFVAAAVVAGFSAYSYVKLAHAYPSAGGSFEAISAAPRQTGAIDFLGAVALGILAYKGFTTITNSGDEIEKPKQNIGRAIMISISMCMVLYLLVALAVGANLTIEEIVKARDYSLAEAARPAFGNFGLWFTVGLAIVATVSGVIASVFAVSRMLAMLTKMQLVPHRHFGMPGRILHHTLVYTVVLAILLTIFFNLSRIASLGTIFYIVMDIAIHCGVLRRLRKEVEASVSVLVTAIALDAVVLGAFLWVKVRADGPIVWMSVVAIALVFIAERWFLRVHEKSDDDPNYRTDGGD